MNNDVVKMLEWLGEQYQFKPGYKKEDPEQSFRKMDAWFNRVYITMFTNLIKLSGINELYKEPAEEKLIVPKKYSEHEKEISKIAEKTTVFTPYDKSHPLSSGWHTFRFESVISLHKIGKTDEEIAKIINSTPVKVRKIINDYEFSQI